MKLYVSRPPCSAFFISRLPAAVCCHPGKSHEADNLVDVSDHALNHYGRLRVLDLLEQLGKRRRGLHAPRAYKEPLSGSPPSSRTIRAIRSNPWRMSTASMIGPLKSTHLAMTATSSVGRWPGGSPNPGHWWWTHSPPRVRGRLVPARARGVGLRGPAQPDPWLVRVARYAPWHHVGKSSADVIVSGDWRTRQQATWQQRECVARGYDQHRPWGH